MFEVTLKSLGKASLHRLERVVQKHDGGISHPQRISLLERVVAGQPQIVARYKEAHVASNVVAEYAVHGADAEVAEQKSSPLAQASPTSSEVS